MITRRRFAHGLGAAVGARAALAAAPPGLLAGCGGTGDEDGYGAWQGPPDGLDVPRRLVAWARLAPSSHNLQPWRVQVLSEESLLLFADAARLHPATDPDFRQTTISQGTFLELLRLAAEASGLQTDISLFPDGLYAGAQDMTRKPVAAVRWRPGGTAPPDPLFSAALTRRTTRTPFTPRAVGPAARDALLAALPGGPGGGGVAAGWLDSGTAVERLRGLMLAGVQTEMRHPPALEELAGVMRLSAAEVAERRDGLVPVRGVAAWALRTLFGRAAFTDPDSLVLRQGVRDMEQGIASAPAFLWLVTADNSRAAQVAAGRAYLRLDLAAARRGLGIQPFSQPLEEYPAMAATRAETQAFLARPGQVVQMLARIGHPDAPAPPSPRRGVDALAG